jgi:hypothetical protein
MASSKLLCLSALVATLLAASSAAAQQSPQGFALDRLYLSAPGGGWFVMDTLDMHGGLGGVVALTANYARDPLRVSRGAQSLTVVSDQFISDLGLAVTYDRWRFYLNLDVPMVTDGQAGAVGGYTFLTPKLDLGMQPDVITDARLGVDVRLFGKPGAPLRLGAGGQLFFPNGPRTTANTDGSYSGCSYGTDGTYRGMVRALAAGDLGRYSYAAQLGVHVRPLDDATPGNPQGSALLFGVAAGSRFLLGADGGTALVVGPEVYGETALGSFFGPTTTGLEGLLTGRLEGTAERGPNVRLKIGAGGGLDAQFGAPEWRAVVGIELFDLRDGAGMEDTPAKK